MMTGNLNNDHSNDTWFVLGVSSHIRFATTYGLLSKNTDVLDFGALLGPD